MRIDLNLFRVFEAIYTEGSLTRAAAQLNLTQPAISHALNRLRDQIDDPLFVRSGHKMTPTPVARHMIGEVQQAIQQLQQAVQKARAFDPQSSTQKFVISLHESLEAAFLPPLISRFQTLAPHIQLTSTHIKRKQLSTALTSATVDLAIDIPLAPDVQLSHQMIRHDPLVVVCRAGHPLVKHRMSMDNYLAATHILVSSRPSGTSLEDYELGRLDLARNIQFRCQHYFAASEVIACSDFMLTLPRQAAQIFCQRPGLEIHPFPFNIRGLDLQLYWHKKMDDDPGIQWLKDQIIMLAGQTSSGL